MPAAEDGVPLIVITLLAHAAETPVGRPVGAPMPVAPGVLMVIFVISTLAQTVGFDEGEPTQPMVI